MKDELNRVFDKLDKLDDRLDKMNTNLAVYNEQLKVHIKRTTIIEKDLVPIKTHINYVEGVGKFISLLAIIITIAAAIYNFL